jgi:hypothetical protein
MTEQMHGNKGRVVSQETRERISAALKGRTVSEETKARIARAHVGRKHSAETKAKISAAHRGRVRPPVSAETRARMSAARQGRGRPGKPVCVHGVRYESLCEAAAALNMTAPTVANWVRRGVSGFAWAD